MLRTCKHEFPTNEYCLDAFNSIELFKQQRHPGAADLSPPTCTNSLGWKLFKRLSAPVGCDGCMMWSGVRRKQTYAAVTGQQTQVDVKRERESSVDKDKKRIETESACEKIEDTNEKTDVNEKADENANDADDQDIDGNERRRGKRERSNELAGGFRRHSGWKSESIRYQGWPGLQARVEGVPVVTRERGVAHEKQPNHA